MAWADPAVVPSPARAEARIDLFSGRPAPSWTLTPEETSTLRAMLAGLSPGGTAPRTGLGYRGVVVLVESDGDRSALRVWRGAVAPDPPATGVLVDEGRRVERFLWDSARRHLPEDVLAEIEPHVDVSR